MAQKGIDALAELWEETGTFRIKVEKNITDGMETLTDGNLATKVFDWFLANLKKKKAPPESDCGAGLIQTEPNMRHLNSYLFCIRVDSPLGLFLELVQSD